MSQPLIDLDIGHEQFKRALDEKEKYDQMKDNIRNKKMEINLVKIHKLTKRIVFYFALCNI